VIQTILLLYFLAIVSGVAAFTHVAAEYRRYHDKATGLYLRYFGAYSFMVAGVGFLSYARVNLVSNLNLEQLSVSFILVSAGWVARENAIWNFSSRRMVTSSRMKTLMMTTVVTGFISGIGFWIFPDSIPIALAVGATMTLFTMTVAATLITTLRRDRSEHHLIALRTWKRTMFMFLAFSLLIIGLEFTFFRPFTLNHGWFIGLPLIYTIWNILVMALGFHPGTRQDQDSIRKAVAPYSLTPKELEVVRYITDGRTNHEISYVMKISRSTVKNHISSIYRKTGVSGRVNLVNLIRVNPS
jgi:DNA-binding CsgD family transcriptional regulator